MALTTAFAKNGNKKAVPQTTQDGSVSYDQGFGNLYALPPEEGGLFIDRAQFNQIMFDTTSAVISNQNSITTLNSKVTANQNSINTLNTKVANIESGVSTGVVNLTGNQTIQGVKTFSSPPVSATNPTANNQVANKAYVDSVVNAKANANAVVTLTGNQTVAGVKTFSSPVVVPNATDNTHAVNLAQLNTKANQATTYTKTEVDTRVNAKANANAVVALTGNQTIAGIKTFSSPPISATNPTANNQVANKAYVDTVGNAKVALTKYSSEVLIPLTKNLVWSVGTTRKSEASKHFNSIDLAIKEALKYRQTPNKFIDLYLTSDITVPSQLYYYGVDLKHLQIHGGRSASNAGFKIIAGANLNDNKNIKYIFQFDESYSPVFAGVTFKGNWVPNTTPRPTGMQAGAKADNGIRAVNNSYLYIHDCRFENFYNATLIAYNSKAWLNGSISSIENCNAGIHTYDNTDVTLWNVTILNTNKAVRSNSLGRAYFAQGSISKCSLGLEVMYGGSIATNGTTLALQTDETNKNTKDANVAYNAVTKHGIIFKN